jgi:hypothetical protein
MVEHESLQLRWEVHKGLLASAFFANSLSGLVALIFGELGVIGVAGLTDFMRRV